MTLRHVSVSTMMLHLFAVIYWESISMLELSSISMLIVNETIRDLTVVTKVYTC